MLTKEQIQAMFRRAQRMRHMTLSAIVSIGAILAFLLVWWFCSSSLYSDFATDWPPLLSIIGLGLSIAIIFALFWWKVIHSVFIIAFEPGAMFLFPDGTIAATWDTTRYLLTRDISTLRAAGIQRYPFADALYHIETELTLNIPHGQRPYMLSVAIKPMPEANSASDFYRTLGMTTRKIKQSLQYLIDGIIADGTAGHIASKHTNERNRLLRDEINRRLNQLSGHIRLNFFRIDRKYTFMIEK